MPKAGEDALRSVILRDNIESAKLLIKHGAKISEYALECTAYNSNKEVAELLLKHGAKIK